MWVDRESWQHIRNECQAWSARYDDLLSKYHELKAVGYQAEAPTPIKALPKRSADPVAEVIADVAGSNHALRRQLGAFARAQKRDGMTDEDITHKLLNWDDDDQGISE